MGDLVASKTLAEISKAPPTLRALRDRVRAAKAARLYADAIEAYAEAAKHHDGDADLLNEFAWFLVTVRDKKFRDASRAVGIARRAVDLSGGKNGAILDTLAEALYQKGDLEEAARLAARAAELAPRGEIKARAKRFADELEARRREKGKR